MTLLDAVPYAIAGTVALGGVGYYLHCEQAKKDRDQLVTQLRAEAEAQRRGIATKVARDKQTKERIDAQVTQDRAALQRTIQRLRNDRARASSVPAAPATSSRPELACFSRADLDRAVGNLEAGMESLLGEGAAATIDLDAAKAWAVELGPN